MKNLVFPVRLDDFVAYQAAGIGRKLTEDEHGAFEAWIPVLNDCYKEGRRRDREALVADIDKMDELIRTHSEGNPAVVKFLETMESEASCFSAVMLALELFQMYAYHPEVERQEVTT